MDLDDLQALMGESLESNDYRDLWVVAPDTISAEGLLGEARRMADSLGAYVHYIGAGNSEDAIAYGVDRVHTLAATSGDEIVSALASFFETNKPEYVFLPAGVLGNEVVGRLAQRLNGGAVYDAIALRIDDSTRELIASHPVYDSAYYLDTAITAKPAFVTVRAGTFATPYHDSGRSGEVDTIEAASGENRVRSLGAVETPTWHTSVPLHKASKVLALGRWGNDDASAAVAKELAEKIGAHLAGDRSAYDVGWITREQIVGVIGTEVAPDLYIAAGIQGDTLHRVGVEGAKFIIAIHPDKDAPIFKDADACIVGKPKDVLPELLKKLG
jgi:electron transfer flavoprotein alpha subunit